MIIGVGGASCSGKSTLCSWLHYFLQGSQILRQDSFFKSDSEIPVENNTANWDCPDALKMSEFKTVIEEFKKHQDIHLQESKTPDPKLDSLIELKEKFNVLSKTRVLIVDGFMLYNDPQIYSNFDICIFLTASKEKLKFRRQQRSGYVTTEGYWADPENYFDDFVWPQYVKYNKNFFNGNIPGIISLSSDSGGIEKMVQDAVNLICERIQDSLFN